MQTGQRRVQANDKELEDPSSSHVVEISNIPEITGKGPGMPPDRFLVDLFNTELTSLPDFDSRVGELPIAKSWLQGKSMAVMEMQNPALAASAARTLQDLHIFGSTIKVRILTLQEADAVKQPLP